uniref:Uncharacterized protein n=1 Tax=Arundo donax TaxID=35708 RepID=A0A0A9ELR3_ARUDO
MAPPPPSALGVTSTPPLLVSPLLLPPPDFPSSLPPPPPPSWSLVSSRYISSTIGFHSRTLALMNQLDTWLLVRPVCLASMILSESLGYLRDNTGIHADQSDADTVPRVFTSLGAHIQKVVAGVCAYMHATTTTTTNAWRS